MFFSQQAILSARRAKAETKQFGTSRVVLSVHERFTSNWLKTEHPIAAITRAGA